MLEDAGLARRALLLGAAAAPLFMPAIACAQAQTIPLTTQEVGDWTPTLKFQTPGDSTFGYGIQSGTYIKTGRMVQFNMALTFTPSFSTAAGPLEILGLPYALDSHPNSENNHMVAHVGPQTPWPANRTYMTACFWYPPLRDRLGGGGRRSRAGGGGRCGGAHAT